MVEAAAHEPAVGDYGFADLGRAFSRGDLMAVRAAGESRRAHTAQSRDVADGSGARVAEEYPPLQLFTGRKLNAELRHLPLHEIVQLAPAGDALHSRAEVGVGRGQAAQERAHVLGVSVRDAQLRIVHVKLEGVTGPAV